MNQIVTKGIVLSRVNYGEADRIITVLTPRHGKLSLMARGVRKPKSKLAGGIELFSVSSLTYTPGKGSVGTLISSRLEKHYGQIVKFMPRVQLGYDLLKILDKATEAETEPAYFELLQEVFAVLNNPMVDVKLVRLWFYVQLLTLAGHQPNLTSDSTGTALSPLGMYLFDPANGTFIPKLQGKYRANHIKFLRLIVRGLTPERLQQVQDSPQLTADLLPIMTTMLQTYIRVQ